MKSERKMIISFMLNFVFTIIEFFGGIITNSVALISDAIHDFGDSISMGIAIGLEKKAKKKPDQTYTFGYRRFSLLGALISSLILLVGSTFVIIETISRLQNPEQINSELLIYFAILGVVVNGAAALNIAKSHSINERMISLHLLEDVFGWITLLIGAIIIHFTDTLILDALLSLGFTLYILSHVFKNLKQIFQVLLERVPHGLNVEEIKQELLVIKDIKEIHHIHLWSLEGQLPLITLHARLVEPLSTEDIAAIQNQMIAILERYDIHHSTIQVEFKDTVCKDENCVPDEALEIGHHHHHHH